MLCEFMNFHPNKQLFQVASAGDQTTDPWIKRTVLYAYTTRDSPILSFISSIFELYDCYWPQNCDSGVAQLNDIIFDSSMSIEHTTMVDFVKNDPKFIQMFEF